MTQAIAHINCWLSVFCDGFFVFSTVLEQLQSPFVKRTEPWVCEQHSIQPSQIRKDRVLVTTGCSFQQTHVTWAMTYSGIYFHSCHLPSSCQTAFGKPQRKNQEGGCLKLGVSWIACQLRHVG